MPQLPAVMSDIFNLCIWLTVLVVVFVPLERLFAVRPEKILRKGILVDLAYYFLSGLLPALLLSVPVALLAWAAHRVVPGFVLETTASLPIWARVIAAAVVAEVGYYWGHRWSHEVPLLWRFHAIHHSAEHVDFLVHSRSHPVDMVFGRFCMLVPIYVLGLGSPLGETGSVAPVAVSVIGVAWGFFIHANLRWRFGPLEWLISTPAFHHWHHTKSGPINRNYSSTLPLIDWVFGSLYLPKEWPADYGIKAKMPDSLVDQLFYPLMPAPAPPALEVPAEPPAPSTEAEPALVSSTADHA